MAVHQLIPSFVSGDATGQAALHFQLLLRRLGHYGEIYAGEVEPALSSLALPARALRPEPDDLVLYHHGIASPLSGQLLHLPCRRGLVFHNITPARFYEGAPLHEALVGGRAQLAAMAPHLDLAIGVSKFNAAELTLAGAKNVRVVPLFVEPERFAPDAADVALAEKLAHGGPSIVSVSRVAPHKRFEDLLALHAEVLRLRPDARLIVAGGYEAGSRYWKSLQHKMHGLTGIEFLGRVTHAQLVAAYRAGSVFVSMSEHEGFGVPLIEAMASELPVLAYGAAAVPETLGGAGIAFTEKRFAFLAELVNELFSNEELRAKVLAGQQRRLEELSADNAQAALEAALKTVLPPTSKKRTSTRRSSSRKPKVALIVQRYGEVTGGAEKHAEQIAHKLSPHWDLTVFTTCAKDHLSWKNEFPDGDERIGPVKVKRFPVRRPREIRRFNALSKQRFGRPLDRMHEEHWIAEQGPLSPGLFRHLAQEKDRYHGFLFFTYLYTSTVWGLPLVAEKSLLVPTVHDEPPLYFHAYSDALERPRALLCNTPEEEALIARRFPDHARSRVVGVGVEPMPADVRRFRHKYELDRPYLLYVGRVEPGKGVNELLSHYRAFRRAHANAPDLVLAGGLHMTVEGEGVRYLGRITDQDKWDAMSGAVAVVVPSRFESLSLLALEGFASGAPVVANAASEVLVGQIARSKAGVCYSDAASFISAVEQAHEHRARFARAGRAFAKKHSWENVVSIYRDELARIMKEGGR